MHIVAQGSQLLVGHTAVQDNRQQVGHKVDRVDQVEEHTVVWVDLAGEHIVVRGVSIDLLALALVPEDMAVIPLVHTLRWYW